MKIKQVLVEIMQFFSTNGRASERARGGMRECNDVSHSLYARHVIETCFPRFAVVVFCFSTSFASRKHEDSLAFLPILGLVSLQPRPMNN